MTKTLIKYLLSLSILLLSGYSHLYAHTYQESTFCSPTKNLKETEHASLGIVQHGQTFVTKSSTTRIEKSFTIEFTNIEEEENELNFSKKYLKGSNFFTAIFYALLFEYFFRYFKKILPFCKRFSYFSSLRSLNLIFCVFRI